MDKKVPNVDAKNGGSPNDAKLQELEFRLLEADARAKETKNRETDQRYYLRWATVFIAISLIVIMIFVLFHMSHVIFIGPVLTVPSAYAMTLVIVRI